MAENDTIEYSDEELLERLEDFMSDSPYEERLIMSARARIRALLAETSRNDEELHVWRANCEWPD